jgi:hypothetical protein
VVTAFSEDRQGDCVVRGPREFCARSRAGAVPIGPAASEGPWPPPYGQTLATAARACPNDAEFDRMRRMTTRRRLIAPRKSASSRRPVKSFHQGRSGRYEETNLASSPRSVPSGSGKVSSGLVGLERPGLKGSDPADPRGHPPHPVNPSSLGPNSVAPYAVQTSPRPSPNASRPSLRSPLIRVASTASHAHDSAL